MISLEDLKLTLANLDEDAVMALLDQLGDADSEAAAAALAACQAGMDEIGERYQTGEYFVADLIYAGDIMTEAAARLKPLLAGTAQESLGCLVLCTVKGDIHDIGKNIVKALLEASGIEVIDLGVDVSPEAAVQAVKQSGAKVLALSAVLTIAIESMKQTVQALKAAGLDDVKVIIGGALVTADYCEVIGADAWTINAAEGAGICRDWLAG